MKRLIIIADWGADSLFCQEVRTAVEGYLKDRNGSVISFIISTSSTIHTAFLVNQVVEHEERYGKPLETVIFQNTDHRLHSKNAKPLIVRLRSGIYLTGPNAGFNFSLVKNKIDEAFEYKGISTEGQFLSRDLYSRLSAHLMDYMEDELELEEVSLNNIPPLLGHYIGHIDNFGNIKTLITHEELKGKYEYGDFITVRINKVTKKALYVSNLFGAEPGVIVIYPGNSGSVNNRYLEISAWTHFKDEKPATGAYFFNNPRPGMPVEIML